jgi:hypothetical protein
MFHDDEIDEVFLEFRRLSRRLGGSSTPIIRDIIRSIKRATNEIRRSHWRAGVEDGPEDGVAEEANGGRLGDRQSRDDNSLLGHEVLSMGMTGKSSRCRHLLTTIDMVSDTVPGNMRAFLDSTPKAPVDDDRYYRIGESHAVGEAIATHTTDKGDNRVQQNQGIPGMGGQERVSNQEVGGGMKVDYEAGPVDAETLRSDGTNQFGGKGDATSTGLHCDSADPEHNRTQQNLPSSSGQDGEQAQDQTREQTQDQTREQTQDQTREQTQDQTRERTQDQIQDYTQDHTQD